MQEKTKKYSFICICHFFVVSLHTICVHMRLLLILLSVFTLTVETKNQVSADGTWPYNMEVEYSNTGTKGNVTQDDVAALHVTSLGGIAIEKINVYVKSNQDAGAGNFEARVNEGTVTLATKSGTFKEWTGNWDGQNYHAITLYEGSFANVHDLSIHLIGTANSLHIEKYEVTWAAAPARTVTLMKGNQVYSTITEASGGAGILLPAVSDTADWRFIGWSETNFWTVEQKPTTYAANTTYYPESNCSLWAVYHYQPGTDETYLTELKSGTYLYVNSANNIAIKGVPQSDGTMAHMTAATGNEDLHYYIEFNAACDSATIKHVKTNTYIGFNTNGTKLVSKASKWCVTHTGDKTGFYMNYGTVKTFILWPDMLTAGGECACLVETNDVTITPTALMLIPDKPEKETYTCHPGEEQSTEIPAIGTEKEAIVRFGLYELHIKNGQKYLYLRQ